MRAKDLLVLPVDLVLKGVSEFPPDQRLLLGGADDDFVLTRWRSRARSVVVDARAAAFLEEFRSPTTVIDAVMRCALRNGEEPTELLEAVMPLLFRLRSDRFIAIDGELGTDPITPTLSPSAFFANIEIIRCVHLFEDVEVYRGILAPRLNVAVKILRPKHGPRSQEALEREAAILTHLAGRRAPKLLANGRIDGRPYLVQSWCDGISATSAAAMHRSSVHASTSPEISALCLEILRAYTELHSNGVVHGDVHPGNILVDRDGNVTLVDFGLATSTLSVSGPPPHRGGIHQYLEPEYCHALLTNKLPPAATHWSDQYGLGSLLFFLITGRHRQEFSLDRDVWLRQVAEGVTSSFPQIGFPTSPLLEAVLLRSVEIEPNRRFASTEEFLIAFQQASTGMHAGSSSRPPETNLLDAILERVAPKVLPSGGGLINNLLEPRCSLNFGAAGVAWFLYRTAGIRDDPRLLSMADVWCTQALGVSTQDDAFYCKDVGITSATVGEVSPFHTLSGIHLVQAHVSLAMGDLASAARSTSAFEKACTQLCVNPDATIGVASILLGCCALVELLHDEQCDGYSSIRALGEHCRERLESWISDNGINGSEMRWLGFAHGWTGVLFALLRWTESLGVPVSSVARERLYELSSLGREDVGGTFWPLRTDGVRDDGIFHLGWCHGNAGYVLLWALAYQVLEEKTFLANAVGAARRISSYLGIQNSKDPSLCCGYTGQAFSLLSLYRVTRDERWYRLAQEMADSAVQFARNSPRPDSLYKGEVGVALLIEELTQPLRAGMPLIESQGWRGGNRA
jgi:eukaryotic-like serine/threonine-protein kinase